MFQQIAKIQQSFWKKWSVDYLNRLQNSPKWSRPRENVKVNDLVLLREDNVPPLKWPLARVVDTMPGQDGKVRVVKLKTIDGQFTRAISKISVLPNQGKEE